MTQTFYICVGPRCWGKSKQLGTAIMFAKRNYANFRDNTGSRFMPYDVYEVDEGAYVDDMGNIRAQSMPKKIREVRFVGNQRTVKEKFDEPMQPLHVH